MRSFTRFIVQQCVESRFCLACFCFNHVQLRYNVALKPLREVPHWGLDRTSMGTSSDAAQSKKPWVSKSGMQEDARRHCRKRCVPQCVCKCKRPSARGRDRQRANGVNQCRTFGR